MLDMNCIVVIFVVIIVASASLKVDVVFYVDMNMELNEKQVFQ